MSSGPGPNYSGKKKKGGTGPRLGWSGTGYLGNAFFQDLLVDVKEASSEVVPFDGARRGNRAFSRLNGILKIK